MRLKPLRNNYVPGTIIQYRDGNEKVKTDRGLIPLARHVASMSSKVVNGGEDLQPGWRVMHLNMSSFGTPEHNKPWNLVVIKCRNTKFEFLKSARIVFEPKTAKERPIAILTKGLVLR